MVACALLRRIHVPNKTFFGCGGHTSGQVYVDGEWRLFDVDAFKKQLPLDDKGNLPAISWLKKDNNWLLLDTLPAWEDSPREEGWITDRGGTQITGTLGGGRDRSEIGYASEWINGGVKCKLYPPSVPQLLPVRYRQGNRVLLEWIGSYARNNNLQGYEVEIQDISSGHCVQYRTDKTFLMLYGLLIADIALAENNVKAFFLEKCERKSSFFFCGAGDDHFGSALAEPACHTEPKP